MILHSEVSNADLTSKIRQKNIVLAGNRRLKIYGTMSCNSGKKMKRENRIFFISEKEAVEQGYRPCGRCLPEKYQKWKNEIVR